MKFELKQHFQIESARFLPRLPASHPCSRTHGHSFKIVLSLVGDAGHESGWVVDYNEITEVTRPVLAEIDHRLLNDIPGLENPTTEMLCKWLFEKLRGKIPQLRQVGVMETSTTECWYPAL